MIWLRTLLLALLLFVGAPGCAGSRSASLTDRWPQGQVGNPPPDELWVIERAGVAAPPAGLGALAVADALPGAPEPLVLESVGIAGTVTGPVAALVLTQAFRNPRAQVLGATFNFPLPPHALITGFEVTVGMRRIRAVIRERVEAQAMYDQARRQGLRAALLTESAPGFFTHRIDGIPARGRVQIELSYDDVLAFTDGAWTLSIPLRTHWTHHGRGAPTLAASLAIDGAPDAMAVTCPSHAARVTPASRGVRVELAAIPLTGDELTICVRPRNAAPRLFVAGGDERILLRVAPGAVHTERLEPGAPAPARALPIESSGRGPVHRLWVRRETYAARAPDSELVDLARKHAVVTPLTGLLIVDPAPPGGG